MKKRMGIKGAAMEWAIVFGLVIFAIAAALTTTLYVNRSRTNRAERTMQAQADLDQIGEYFVRAMGLIEDFPNGTEENFDAFPWLGEQGKSDFMRYKETYGFTYDVEKETRYGSASERYKADSVTAKLIVNQDGAPVLTVVAREQVDYDIVGGHGSLGTQYRNPATSFYILEWTSNDVSPQLKTAEKPFLQRLTDWFDNVMKKFGIDTGIDDTPSVSIITLNYNYDNRSDSRNVSVLNPSIVLPMLTRKGYYFDGWFTQAVGGLRVDEENKRYSPAEHGDCYTLYAHWTPYTFYCDFNSEYIGVLPSVTETFSTAKNKLPSHPAGRDIRGFYIEGWYLEPEFVTLAGKPGSTGFIPASDGVTLYARWDEIPDNYKVVLNFNNNTTDSVTMEAAYDPESNVFYVGSLDDSVLSHLVYPGHSFDHWRNGEDDSTVDTYTALTSPVTNLFAEWTPYEVLLVDKKGRLIDEHSNLVSSLTLFADQEGYVTLPESLPDYNGVPFDGFYTEEAMNAGVKYSGSFIPEGDMTLYVHFSTFTVTYEVPGAKSPLPEQFYTGEIGTEAIKAYTDSQVNTEALGKRTGYHIAGWDGSDGKYYEAGAAITALTENLTLTAVFEANTYKVTFDKGSSSAKGTMNDETFVYDVPKKLTKNAFTLSNHVFIGWKDRNGKTYTDEQEVSKLIGEGTLVLTAQWAETYTLSFSAENSSFAFTSYGSLDSTDKLTDVPEGSTVTVSGHTVTVNYLTGKTVTRTAVPKSNGCLDNWGVEYEVQTGSGTQTVDEDLTDGKPFKVEQDLEIIAYFLKAYSISVSSNDTSYGTVSASSFTNIPKGKKARIIIQDNKLTLSATKNTPAQVITATPIGSSKFSYWTVNGTQKGNGAVEVSEGQKIVAVFTPSFKVTLKSSNDSLGFIDNAAAIDLVPKNTTYATGTDSHELIFSFANGTTITVKAKEMLPSGMTFTGWSVNGDANKTSLSGTITGDITFTANFVPTVTVSFRSNNSDYGYVDPASLTDVPSGSTYAITEHKLVITYNDGKTTHKTATVLASNLLGAGFFSSWDKAASGTISGDTTFTANFVKACGITVNCTPSGKVAANGKSSYTLYAPAGGNYTVNGNKLIVSDGTKTLETVEVQTTGEGAFQNFTDSQGIISSKRTVNGAVTVTANFAATYTVTVTADGNGTVDKTSILNVPDKSTITVSGNKLTITFNDGLTEHKTAVITASPTSGGAFKDWTVSSGNVTGANTTITANFIKAYTVTVKKGIKSSETISGVPEGSTYETSRTGSKGSYTYKVTIKDPQGKELKTVTAVKEGNGNFKNWTSSSNPSVSGETISGKITADTTITANFESYQVSVVSNDTTRGTVSISSGYSLPVPDAVSTWTVSVSNGNLVINHHNYSSGSSTRNIKETVTPTAKSGYYFDGWYYENGNPVSSSEVKITSDLSIIARFLPYAKVSVKSADTALGTVDPASIGGYKNGTTLYIRNISEIYTDSRYGERVAKVTPVSGANSYFTGWKLNGSPVSVSFEINDGDVLTAEFARYASVKIETTSLGKVNATSFSGVKSGETIHVDGRNLSFNNTTVTASENGGYFDGWYVNGTKKTESITVSDGMTITAKFLDFVKVNVAKDGPGSVSGTAFTNCSPYETITVNNNKLTYKGVTVTATATDAGYFDGWYVGSTKQSDSIAISANMTVTAKFIAYASVSVEATALGKVNASSFAGARAGGTIRISGKELSYNGTTITATENGGYFDGWYVGGTKKTESITITDGMTITAKFLNFVKVNVTTEGAGSVSASAFNNCDPNKTITVNSSKLTYNGTTTVTATAQNNVSYFDGWYVGGTKQTGTITISDGMTVTAKFIAYPKVQSNDTSLGTVNASVLSGYEVGDTFYISDNKIKSGSGWLAETLVTASEAANGYFGGWFNGDSPLSGTVTVTADMTVTAKFYKTVKVTISGSDYASVSYDSDDFAKVPVHSTISVSGTGNKKLTITFPDGDTVSATASSNSGGEFTEWSKESGEITAAITITANSKKSEGGGGGGSCIADGTMITLADGSKKAVEDLSMDDEILVFNHETGKVEAGKINFFEADGWKNYEIINLVWSNGTASRIIYEHGFFDLDEMKYVYIHAEDCREFIGHRFFTTEYENGEFVNGEVTLLDAYVTNEYAGCYSFPSEYHLNMYMDDLLSMPGGIEGMFNIFEYGENLQYDQEKMAEDIAAYGLFDYEVLADVMSYDTFHSYAGQYLSVALGKGVMTEEQLAYLIERYAVPYEK